MLPDIKNKRFVVLGMQGTGKSVLVKHFLKNTKNSIVYDVLHEHSGLDRYFVDNRQVLKSNSNDPAIAELNSFVNQVVTGSGHIRLFILEEANRYCPPKPIPLPASILDLNDFQRHENVAFGVVARRPTQLHTDLIDLAHYLFIFSLQGKHDKQYLDDVMEGLADMVSSLKPYHFVIVDSLKGEAKVHAPIPY